ncbi:c-type cytochrome [Bordetella sp. 2513F-2]
MHSLNRLALCGLLGLLASPGAGAQTVGGEGLARSKACMACHQVEDKRVGPPLRSIAERYAGQAEALDYLAGKIRGGGRGAWGAVPMPAQPQVSEDEARQLAQWVLSLSPAKP